MKDRKILYIGEGPPYLGGITKKSSLLEKKIGQYHIVKAVNVNVKNNKIISFGISLLKMIFYASCSDGIIYCLDNSRMYLMLWIQRLLYRKSMEKTIVVYSGGEFDQLIDDKYKWVTDSILDAKQLWIEIKNVETKLVNYGYKNIVYYPNPRIIEISKEPKLYYKNTKLKLLYYSQISREKGLMDVIEVVKFLNSQYNISFTIDFYGLVKEDVQEIFDEFIKTTENATYKGFNNASNLDDYYNVLNMYDIMLFPTYWSGEGIAGACVEAKIAGIAILASNHNYNFEIVDEAQGEGIIFHKGNIAEISEEIYKLYCDSERLNQMKKSSYDSRIRFSVESYEKLYKECFD